MARKNQIEETQINISDLLIIIWEGKLKIIFSIIISVLILYTLSEMQKKNFTAKTQVKPISSSEEYKYISFNNLLKYNLKTLNFEAEDKYKISKDFLLNLFIETLDEKSVFEDAIRKYNLIDENLYANEKEYDNAIANLASSIEIIKPKIDDDSNKSKYNTIEFTYHDFEKWKSILLHVDKYTNEIVKQIINKHFEELFSSIVEVKKYTVEDISKQIQKEIDLFNYDLARFEQEQNFKIEDIENKITNSVSDYRRNTLDRLSYLKEQAAMARKLNIEKNTIEAITYNTEYEIIANVKTDSPFYLRGYEAIEKEIEIIEKRENIYPFVNNLFELEKKKRELEQDKTIQRGEKRLAFLSTKIDLDIKRKNIVQDKSLERARNQYESIFLTDNENFLSASIDINGTKFIKSGIDDKILILQAMAIGLIIGLFYVYISNSLQSSKYTKKR